MGLQRLDILRQLQCYSTAAASNLVARRPAMIITHEQDVLKSEKLAQQFAEMQEFVSRVKL